MGEISDAFLEGMQELYSIMFTKEIYLSLLKEEVDLNIFRETEEEEYHDPIAITGKVAVSTESADEREALENVKYDFIFTIPTKELIDKSIPHRPQDFLLLKKAKITYQNVSYDINYVQPTTNIEGVYLFYMFYCAEISKESGEEY
jgi:hypothetical protein